MRRVGKPSEPLMSPQLAIVTIAGLVFLALAGYAIWDFLTNFPGFGQD